MEKQHALQQLEQLQKKLYAIHYACSAMNLDADTVAPKNTSEGRGVALGVLAGEEQQLMICPGRAESSPPPRGGGAAPPL